MPVGEPLLAFKRCVAHFCVDSSAVSLTARLAGAGTRFLPFNRGEAGGAGNPPAEPGKFRTSYLWERVWAKETWLDILARFVVLSVEERRGPDGRKTRKESLIFPRWRQLDAVLAIEAAIRE